MYGNYNQFEMIFIFFVQKKIPQLKAGELVM